MKDVEEEEKKEEEKKEEEKKDDEKKEEEKKDEKKETSSDTIKKNEENKENKENEAVPAEAENGVTGEKGDAMEVNEEEHEMETGKCTSNPEKRIILNPASYLHSYIHPFISYHNIYLRNGQLALFTVKGKLKLIIMY